MVLIALRPGLGQQAQSPTLDEILARLESNLQRYDTQVPNFFCSEHVASLMSYGKTHQSTVTDSVFRLERASGSDKASKLMESREIKMVNGSPAEGRQISGPSVLTGVFSGGLDTVSLSQKSCMRYELQPVKEGRPDEPYVVRFATLPGGNAAGCVLKEEGYGRVFIDPATMQVKRMELTAPHHVILPTETGAWKISVDYGPVLFGEQSFWLPMKISSKAIPTEAYVPTEWSFEAQYSEYHKLEVRSRIVPLR